jgi:hypothetical protein
MGFGWGSWAKSNRDTWPLSPISGIPARFGIPDRNPLDRRFAESRVNTD